MVGGGRNSKRSRSAVVLNPPSPVPQVDGMKDKDEPPANAPPAPACPECGKSSYWIRSELVYKKDHIYKCNGECGLFMLQTD